MSVVMIPDEDEENKVNAFYDTASPKGLLEEDRIKQPWIKHTKAT
uniref:Transposase n=1 Tax=Heterorhabditis bacteriophora TaxID=37862 RepID=A0A1I7WSK7_HETBA